MSATWPTPGDYHAAVQNPATSFGDAELRSGSVVCTPLGLPRVASGNFASVYQVRGPNGAPAWAVRCFLRQVADSQRRYAAIDQHLVARRPPSLVGFQYLAQGVRIRGVWYPVVKMEWVEGQPLNGWVEANLGRPERLRALAARWVALTEELAAADIAHGDLQHGNVLVLGDELRLVDYDGMFVPALAGLNANETGHPAYQHPARSARDFGPGIDRFSALVILVALLALAAEPSLWGKYHNGDNLLFRPGDFRDPDRSPLWSQLRGVPDPAVAQLMAALRRACADPGGMPAPADLYGGSRAGTRSTRSNGGAGWWREYVPKGDGGGNGHGQATGDGGRPWWAMLTGSGRATAIATKRDPPRGRNGAAPGAANGAVHHGASALPVWVRVLRGVGHLFEVDWPPQRRPKARAPRRAKKPEDPQPARLPTTGPVIVSRSGKKFHRPDCALVNRIAAGKIAGFPARADALRAGYQPCATCEP